MPKITKIIIVAVTFFILLVIVLYALGYRGYYYDTGMKIGEKRVYRYNEITFTQPKCINRIQFYEDDNHYYYIDTTGCSSEQYYIKNNGKYIDLGEALDKEIITPQEILDSEVKITKEEK